IKGVKATLSRVSHRQPGVVLVGLNDRNPQLHDLYRIDLKSGERTKVIENPGYAAILADDDLKPRLAMAFAPDFTLRLLKADHEGQFKPWLTVPTEDTLSTGPADFDK